MTTSMKLVFDDDDKNDEDIFLATMITTMKTPIPVSLPISGNYDDDVYLYLTG